MDKNYVCGILKKRSKKCKKKSLHKFVDKCVKTKQRGSLFSVKSVFWVNHPFIFVEEICLQNWSKKWQKWRSTRFRGLSLYKIVGTFFLHFWNPGKKGFFFQKWNFKTKLPLTFLKWTKIKMSKMDFYEIIFFFENKKLRKLRSFISAA